MTPDLVLGPALIEAVRSLVRAELQAHVPALPPAPDRSPWMTPPAAAGRTVVPVRTIHAPPPRPPSTSWWRPTWSTRPRRTVRATRT